MLQRFVFKSQSAIVILATLNWVGYDMAFAQQTDPEAAKPLTLPGRIQQQRQAPGASEPLRPIDPVPQWTSQKPVFHSAISQGAVVPVILTSPVELEQLRVGDLIEFETIDHLLSSDGRWKIPKGSMVHAKVASWNWTQTGFKRAKIGLLFYEFITPEGWVVPFEGQLLGLPKPKRNAPSVALTLAEGQVPAGGPGVIIFSKNPLLIHRAEKNHLPMGEVFPLRVGQAIYYGAALAYQNKARRDKRDNAPDTGVIPVNYPYFSDSATQEVERYQDDTLMPVSPH